MRNSASGMFVQCNILSFGERLRKSIFAFRGRIQSSNNTVIKLMYGEFSGASSVKCLEMVAYHTIHWSCDSVVIVSCMHVITNCVTCVSLYVVYGLRV